MKDRADYARKGIARGRGLVALAYDDGIVLVAENPTNTLRKVSEIYDRIAFAGVGKYNEFDQLRVAGVRAADVKGYQYSRDDVDARSLANQYAQILGQVFTHEIKPMEVEILVAEVGVTHAGDVMFHILYDGTVFDEHSISVLGGDADTVDHAGRGGLPGGHAARPRRCKLAVGVAGRPRPHAAGRRAGGRDPRPQQRSALLPPHRGRRACLAAGRAGLMARHGRRFASAEPRSAHWSWRFPRRGADGSSSSSGRRGGRRRGRGRRGCGRHPRADADAHDAEDGDGHDRQHDDPEGERRARTSRPRRQVRRRARGRRRG